MRLESLLWSGRVIFLFVIESLRTHFLQYCIYITLYTVQYKRTVSDIVTEKIKISRAPQRNDFIMSLSAMI